MGRFEKKKHRSKAPLIFLIAAMDGALTQEQMEVSVEGTQITLTNTSGEDFLDIVIYCRSPLNKEYFGGMAYVYTIEQLPAGESTTIDAWDCILGEAEVMRITAAERE